MNIDDIFQNNNELIDFDSEENLDSENFEQNEHSEMSAEFDSFDEEAPFEIIPRFVPPNETTVITPLQGMYKEWFLDYASYVILERAVPHIEDGLKPVQRRILHAMRRLEDGRYNKVANIIGFTMQFHPHGDTSIGDALVQLGQKELLIDTQGNWGNIYNKEDRAAAPRYIEARLTKFALEVVFSQKVTQWKLSYDGRNKEPITLPVKFPLLLAQGVDGIAVGLASKILPHNFNELIDASIAHLENRPFEIYPDFPTGGMLDVARYNDGLRGGLVKVRSRISKIDAKTLIISDIPFGKDTNSVIDSIEKAVDKGKIKIKKIDDNTAQNVEIVIHLPPGSSPDKTIDALYAFTDCEIPISPNACVIKDNKPHFMGVSDILRFNTDYTVHILKSELEIQKQELEEAWHLASLERIFIENKIYQQIENCETFEAIIKTIDNGLEPFKHRLKREVTRDDIIYLTEIKIKRISRFDARKADEHILSIEENIKETENNLLNIIPYSISYFKKLKKQYGSKFQRKTEIRSFENIEATKVIQNNEKLYFNRQDGFVGTSLKKDEYICDCSDIDDIIIFYKDGKYIISKVQEKSFVGKDIIYLNVFKKNDERTIYNVAYRDGKHGLTYVKRFSVTGITRDREYNVSQGKEGSEIMYFSANPNGEAEILRVTLMPRARIKNQVFDYDMSWIGIKGRGSVGNMLSRYEVHKISLKSKGESTLGGRKIWFEPEVLRLNSDGRGNFLGEFHNEELIQVICNDGTFYHTNFDLTNHYDDNILFIEKFNPQTVWSAVYFDAELKYFYVKRFQTEISTKPQRFIGEHPKSYLVKIMQVEYPRLEIKFGGNDKIKGKMIVEVAEFIGIKGYKAKGKRLTTYQIAKIKELEPLNIPKEVKETSSETQKVENDGVMSMF